MLSEGIKWNDNQNTRHANDDVGNSELTPTLFAYSIGGLTLFIYSASGDIKVIQNDIKLTQDQQFIQSCGDHNTINPFFVSWSKIYSVGEDF